MRTLIVSPRQFWPLDTGGKLRDYHLAAQLAQSAQVTYLCFTDTDEPCPATLAAPFEEIIAIRRGPAYGLKTLVKGLVGSEPATVLNYTTPGMTTALQNLLARKDFDTIQVETVCLAAYMPALRTARSHPGIVTDWHNIESELMDRHAEHTASAPRRLYAQMTAAKLRTAEARQIELSDAVLVPSTRERAKLIQDGAQCPIYVVENGVEAGKFNTTVKRPDASA